jgi:ferredoxin-type protein NapH
MIAISRKKIRRSCQVVVSLAFILIPWLNGHDIRGVSGNLLSLEFFNIPFADPLAALQVWATTGHLARTAAVGAALALLLAAVMGPVFCSWICPFGLLADLVAKLPFVRRPTPSPKAWYGKSILFGAVVAGLAVSGYPPLLDQLSLPGWYTRAMQGLWLSGAIPVGLWLLPAAACLDMAAGGHAWCRHVCPQSLLLQWAGHLLPARFRVTYDPSRCKCSEPTGSPCSLACPYGLDPRKRNIHPQCTNCGDCVVRCTHFGHALSQGFARRKRLP